MTVTVVGFANKDTFHPKTEQLSHNQAYRRKEKCKCHLPCKEINCRLPEFPLEPRMRSASVLKYNTNQISRSLRCSYIL